MSLSKINWSTWTIFSWMKRSLEVRETRFYRWMLSIPYTEFVSNEEFFRKIATKDKVEIFRTHIEKKGMENLTPTVHSEIKRSIEDRVSYLKGLFNWMSSKGVGLIVKRQTIRCEWWSPTPWSDVTQRRMRIRWSYFKTVVFICCPHVWVYFDFFMHLCAWKYLYIYCIYDKT